MGSSDAGDPLWYRIDGVLFALIGNTWVGLDYEGRLVRLDATYAEEISRLAMESAPEGWDVGSLAALTATAALNELGNTSVCRSNPSRPVGTVTAAAIIDDQIAELAQQYWEEEGQPEGKADEHWHRAKHELKRRQSAPLTTPV